ncbi:CheW protein [Saccharicrinis carchari]|uniref:CheW protein n=1 Tax=Saccharicrinis carchari TaxID=1168039 RepID=A0A521CEW1_SACCC|nr:chemotaxis protein CheW [Saccharicrinis carchari]SMO57967.1 CheW protein [Saccharicrinis carchari]
MKGEFKTLVSFGLQKQTFAFDSLMVRNILAFEDNITKVPNSRDFILGVINLHGIIIPVTDMRRMMNLDEQETTQDTAIIIVSPEDKIESQFGIVVDIVKEVFEVKTENIMPSVYQNKMGLIESFVGAVEEKGELVHLIDLLHVVSQIDSKN